MADEKVNVSPEEKKAPEAPAGAVKRYAQIYLQTLAE